MNKEMQKIEMKYKAQNKLIDEWLLKDLDERTLHEIIKAMLLNTITDCIKYECEIDKETEKITSLAVKNDKNENDLKLLKYSQDRLRKALFLAKISEESLGHLLMEMLMSDEIKNAFKQDIPEMYINLYYLIDIEDEITKNLIGILSESYKLGYKQICTIINDTIAEIVDNVEEYIDDISERELYKEFTERREKWRKQRRECK